MQFAPAVYPPPSPWPTFDGVAGQQITAATTITFPACRVRTAPAATRLVGVALGTHSASQHTITSITWGGNSLTEVAVFETTTVSCLAIYAAHCAESEETDDSVGDIDIVVSANTPRYSICWWSDIRASATPANTYVDSTGPSSLSPVLTAGALWVTVGKGIGNDTNPQITGVKPHFLTHTGTNLWMHGTLEHVHTAETRDIAGDWYSASLEYLISAVWA